MLVAPPMLTSTQETRVAAPDATELPFFLKKTEEVKDEPDD